MQSQPMAIKISAQLHIGNLDVKVQEADVYNLLRPFGDVARLRLCRGVNSSYSFITFKDPEISERARKELNGSKFRDRFISVSRITTQSDSAVNVFVKNFSEALTAKDLDDLFSKFGGVLSTKVCYDESGKSIGYGFVRFENNEFAENSIKNLNGKTIGGQILIVQKCIPLNARIRSIPNANLYVRGFPIEYSEEDLRNVFSQYGKILSIALMSHKARVFGFVCFASAEEANTACENKNGVQENGFIWYVTPHMSKIHRKKLLREQYLQQIEDWKKKNLYIKNLDKSIDEVKLADICQEFGPIKSLKICKIENIKYDSDGNCSKESISKEIAYIYFESEQSANIAHSELQRKLIQGKKLYVAKWKPREVLKKNTFKGPKLNKFPVVNSRGFLNPRSFQRMPMMARGMPAVGFNNLMPRVRGPPRSMITHQSQIPLMENKKAPVFRVEDVDRLTTRDLGEKLYPMVYALTNANIVGKITGMLLEMEKIEIINLINDENRLGLRIKEAVEVLKRAWASDPAALSQLPQ